MGRIEPWRAFQTQDTILGPSHPNLPVVAETTENLLRYQMIAPDSLLYLLGLHEHQE